MSFEKIKYSSDQELKDAVSKEMEKQFVDLRPEQIRGMFRYKAGDCSLEKEEVAIEMLLDYRFENLFGITHGGALTWAQDVGMASTIRAFYKIDTTPTASISIKFYKKCSSEDKLVFRGRVIKIEGSRVTVHGELWRGDELCSETEGVYVAQAKGFKMLV